LSIANYNAYLLDSTHSFQLATTADNKPVEKTFQQFQPVDHKPYSASQTTNTYMPSWKHSALLHNTTKSTNIYTFSGYKMDISITLKPTNSGRHQQLDDKIKEEIQYHIGPMIFPHIQSHRIHTLDDVMMIENIQCSTQVHPANIGKHINQTVHPFLPMLTIPHKANHSATLAILTNPHIPTVSNPQIKKRSSNQNGNIHKVTITPANWLATLYDEIQCCHTVPNQPSHIETNIDKMNNMENECDWNRESTQTTGIVTALSHTTIFTPLNRTQPTRHTTTNPS